MSLVLDIVLVAMLAAALITGYKKGFVKLIWGLAAFVVTTLIVMAVKEPALEMISHTELPSGIRSYISKTVDLPQGGGVNIAENLNLPQFMKTEADNQIDENTLTSVKKTTTDVLTDFSVTIIVCAALFVAIRIILSAVYMVINTVTKIPVIKGVNKIIGSLLSAVNMIFVIFLILSLVALFTPADSSLFEMINNTYIVKYFYNYNILLQLFMKI